MPFNFYEMSFYKFLEQLFYNQELESSNSDCNHLVHKNMERVFQIGPLRFKFSFENRETYSVDLLKFKDIGLNANKWDDVMNVSVK